MKMLFISSLSALCLILAACKSAKQGEQNTLCSSYTIEGKELRFDCNAGTKAEQEGIYLLSEESPLEEGKEKIQRSTRVVQNNSPYSGKLHFWRKKEKKAYLILKVQDGNIEEVFTLLEGSELYRTELWKKAPEPIPHEVRPVRKPVLYFYPEEAMQVKLKLNLAGELLHSYPRYPEGGWDITLDANGQIDFAGKSYYALYWEAEEDAHVYNTKQGFVVAGEDTEAFLEEKLTALGLNRRELNECVMYWLPILEKNKYNFVHFSQELYAQRNSLEMQPAPDAALRILICYRPLEQPIEVEEQELKGFERKGFTIVEWGGMQLPIITQ